MSTCDSRQSQSHLNPSAQTPPSHKAPRADPEWISAESDIHHPQGTRAKNLAGTLLQFRRPLLLLRIEDPDESPALLPIQPPRSIAVLRLTHRPRRLLTPMFQSA